jgi:hypothetical protein
MVHICNPSYSEGGDQKDPVCGQFRQKFSKTLTQSINLAWWHTAVVPTRQEAGDKRTKWRGACLVSEGPGFKLSIAGRRRRRRRRWRKRRWRSRRRRRWRRRRKRRR